MAKAGRKRKNGQRTVAGQLSRKGKPAVAFDQGSDHTKAKVAIYGTDGADAIGRAFRAGLLGDDAQNLRDTARMIARAYWPMLEVGHINCSIGDRTGGGDALDEAAQERALNREQWLTKTLARVDHMDTARRHRRAFDQLCIDVQPDSGPSWLDSIIWHKQRHKDAPIADTQRLALALKALEEVAG